MRPARPAEVKAGRMMLPEVFRSGAAPGLFVAVSESPLSILGIGAVLRQPWGEKSPGFRFAVKVTRPYRRTGIGSALVRAIAEDARAHGAGALRPWLTVPDDTPAAAMLRSLGFQVIRRRFHFEADVLGLFEQLRALRDRLTVKGRIPSTVRVTSLRDAPLPDVLALCRKHLGGDAGLVARALAGRGRLACSRDHSVVLTVDGSVAGALVYGWDGDVARIDGQVLDPVVRRSWANVLLLAGAIERGRETGARRIRFCCYEDVRDTMKLAQRCAAEIRAVENLHALDLTVGTASSPAATTD